MKKYEFAEEKVVGLEYTDIACGLLGKTLRRIRALRTFIAADGRMVKEGELGGWIEAEHNLEHTGNCWVADDAIVCDADDHNIARVIRDAQVGGNAIVYGYGTVADRARIGDDVCISGGFYVGDNARVEGLCRLSYVDIVGDARLCGAREHGIHTVGDAGQHSIISGELYGNLHIYHSAVIGAGVTIASATASRKIDAIPAGVEIRTPNDYLEVGPLGGLQKICFWKEACGGGIKASVGTLVFDSLEDFCQWAPERDAALFAALAEARFGPRSTMKIMESALARVYAGQEIKITASLTGGGSPE